MFTMKSYSERYLPAQSLYHTILKSKLTISLSQSYASCPLGLLQVELSNFIKGFREEMGMGRLVLNRCLVFCPCLRR